MAYEMILAKISNHVCVITLNRPSALNTLNNQLIDEIGHAVTSAENNDKIRCMVITGSEKAFAAGADIKEMAEKTFVEVTTTDLFGASMMPIQNAKKPIIAAVSGYALGGGCELAMMCDFILCSESAKFGQPEINLGVISGIGGTQRLSRIVGKPKAMDMHLTGRFMDAQEAERAGLVSRVVPDKLLMEVTLEVAVKIAEKSQVAVKAVKDSVNRSFETTLSEGLLFERRVFHSMFATDDQKEGMSAFLEKRDPQFRDK